MRRSSKIAVPLVASVAFALIASQRATAEAVSLNERSLTPQAPIALQSDSSPTPDQSTTERGGFGTWFPLVTIVVGAAMAFGLGE